MGLLPLNHFDDPPQLSLQVVLHALKRIMCQRLSRNQGLSQTVHTHTQCFLASASQKIFWNEFLDPFIYKEFTLT